jgi:beta-phosphoglucomutase-like phosphatase (HAD superfamily)
MPQPAAATDAFPMRGQALATRTFWWDRTQPGSADVDLRAVIFDLDGAVAEIDRDGEFAPRAGLLDLVMNLFVSGVWVAVVSSGRRTEVEPLVRELLGDGLVETIVTADDTESAEPSDLYALALWEFGIEPESALALVGSSTALGAATDAGLATAVVSEDYSAKFDSATDCQRAHRRWWTGQKRAA